jgi:thiosulfate dehydrogenase [quinone] large subunit
MDGPGTAHVTAGLPVGLYAIQIVLAYEWLLSGLDKLANPDFSVQLPVMLKGSLAINRYHWYSTLLRDVVLPHVSLLPPTVIAGELAIGVVLVLVLSAVLGCWRPTSHITRTVTWGACAALAGAVGLSLNYSFQQGTPLPWIDSTLAFGPGMGIDLLIACLSAILLSANLWVLYTGSRRRLQ